MSIVRNKKSQSSQTAPSFRLFIHSCGHVKSFFNSWQQCLIFRTDVVSSCLLHSNNQPRVYSLISLLRVKTFCSSLVALKHLSTGQRTDWPSRCHIMKSPWLPTRVRQNLLYRIKLKTKQRNHSQLSNAGLMWLCPTVSIKAVFKPILRYIFFLLRTLALFFQCTIVHVFKWHSSFQCCYECPRKPWLFKTPDVKSSSRSELLLMFSKQIMVAVLVGLIGQASFDWHKAVHFKI